jgi:hypothetical protein
MRNEDMIAIIECFIHHKTDKQIRITKPRTPQQYLLLSKAYENCKDYFIKH